MNTKNPKIAIIDYGVCNLFSILKACKQFSDEVIVTEDPEEVNVSDALIIPGVGSFKSGMDGLRIRNLIKPIRKFAESGKPLLGVCLGAQLLLSTGYEFGKFKGLDIIPGSVVKFSRLKKAAKIPHIGWNTIAFPRGANLKDAVFRLVNKNNRFYFVHSYILEPQNKTDILMNTVYGGREFCSVVKRKNIYGCQFHPEKSSIVGLRIIENFVRLAHDHAIKNN